jgi:MATE family multidrug resistance protein
VNPLLLYVIVDYMEIGYEGLIMSFVIISWFMVISTACYTAFITKQLDGIYQGFETSAAFTGWWPLLSRAFPSTFVLLCVWTASEVNVLLSSNLVTREEFAGAAICQQIISLMYSAPSGISYAVIVKVGNFLGAGDKSSAMLSVRIGVAMTLAWALVVCCGIVVFRGQLAAYFTADEIVQDAVVRAMPYLAMFYTVDTLLAALSSGLRGAGVPHRVAFSAAVGWLVGISLALLLHNSYPSLGLGAFYLGPAIGLVLANVICLYCLITSTWELQDDMIQELIVDDCNKKKTE